MKNSTVYPKISIVTPSLNQGHFIEHTIRSILAQNYPNLEYFVMDGGSSDTTMSVLKKYENQLKWVSEKDNGQTNAINKGFRLASGDILAYINADDMLLPGSLFKVGQKFMADPNIMWVTGKCRIIDDHDREIRRLITFYKNCLLHIHSTSLLLVTDYISQPATFWRAEVFKTLGNLDESLHFAMDYDYWLRLSANYPPTIFPEYLAAFRVHVDSKNTNAGHGREYIDEERLIIERATRSKTLLFLHDIHRWLMTSIYSMINRRK